MILLGSLAFTDFCTKSIAAAVSRTGILHEELYFMGIVLNI